VPRISPPRQRPLTSSTPLNSLAALARLPFSPTAATLRLSLGGDITAAAALRMAEHDGKAVRDVHDLQMILICYLQDRRSAVLRREADHARQGRDLPELDRVEVFERGDSFARLTCSRRSGPYLKRKFVPTINGLSLIRCGVPLQCRSTTVGRRTQSGRPNRFTVNHGPPRLETSAALIARRDGVER
jgi:hypothetical protein